MSGTIDFAALRRLLAQQVNVPPLPERGISLFSAAVVTADPECLSEAIIAAERNGLSYGSLYEIVLQSYLFLGFPRMLTAADVLQQQLPRSLDVAPLGSYSADETDRWYREGLSTCRRVYGDSMEALTARIGRFAPEIAQWMIHEGYGKVLSRPGLTLDHREISIVTFLLLENRDQQLYSHIRGALRVGVDKGLLDSLVAQFAESSPDGTRTAQTILERLG